MYAPIIRRKSRQPGSQIGELERRELSRVNDALSRPASSVRSRPPSSQIQQRRASSAVSLPPIDRSNSLVSRNTDQKEQYENDSNKENTVTTIEMSKSNTFYVPKSEAESEDCSDDTLNVNGVFMTSLAQNAYTEKEVKKSEKGLIKRPPVSKKMETKSRSKLKTKPPLDSEHSSTPDTDIESKKNDAIDPVKGPDEHKSTEYIKALGNLRRFVDMVAKEIDDLKKDFHGSCEDQTIQSHIQNTEAELRHCQHLLKTNGMKMDPLDSELNIVGLLNNLRICKDPDQHAVETLTELWERWKMTIDRCYSIRARFENMVYRRLRNSCRTTEDDAAISKTFSENVTTWMNQLDEHVYDLNTLCRSFANGLKTDLFTEASGFSGRYSKAFPVLRLVPEMTARLEALVTISRAWIDADESFVRQVSAKIRVNKAQISEKLNAYEETQPKHRKMLRSVKIAELMCQNQRSSLRTIEAELQSLESQLHEVNLKKRHIENEVYQKGSMVDFLQISISRTRHNQTLQMKRTRLVKRLTELEKRLGKIGERCIRLTDQLNEKIQKRAALVQSLNGHQNTYTVLKDQLDAFTDRIQTLKRELTELQNYLSQCQQIQDMKLQPESIEEFYDRPPSVKLAPSLKEKISRKRATRLSEAVPLLPRTKRRIPSTRT